MAEKDILLKSGKDVLYPITKGVNVVYGATDSGITLEEKVDEKLASTVAASTYLAKADAATTYLTKTDAGTTYLSKSDASSTYATKSSLATVATSGSYNDLTNKPTIPAAVTVDQTYDGTSTNAQSGTAVAGAIATKQDALPAGDAGKFLKKTANGVEWATVSSGSSLPDQTGQSGKFLTTDGTDASWATVSGGSSGVTPTVVSFSDQTGTTVATGLTLADYDTILVYKNGLLQRETTVSPASTNDYTISTNSIVFTSALVATDIVTVIGLGEVSASMSNYLTKTEAASTYATQSSIANMVSSTTIRNIVTCTQAEYDAMEQAGTLVSTTWYLIRAAQQ